jgi:hypothetical protein
MKAFKFPDKLVILVKGTMESSQCLVTMQSDLSDTLKIMNTLRQCDSIAGLLFNVALEKVVSDANIQTRGTVFCKSIQLSAHADDIDITGRSEDNIRITFVALKTAAGVMGLRTTRED